MNINRIAIKQSVTVLVFLAMVLVVGTFSYMTLPREAAPEVVIPIVSVTVTYQGVAPEDIESLITIPIERKLTGVSDVKAIRSFSLEGISSTVIEFEAGTDIESAMQKVRDKVDMAQADIPPEADDPMINELNISELPVLILSLSGDIGLAALNRIAEDVEDAVESIKGVLDAAIVGGVEREIEIEVDPQRVAQYGVAMNELATIARIENVNTPSGALEMGEAKYLVRVPGEFKTPDELEGLIVKQSPSGAVYLRDIARIKDTFKEAETMARVNDKPAVIIAISKRAGENIITISDQVKALLARAQERLPEEVHLGLTLDISNQVRDMVAELENGILSGLLLVLGVIFLFMGVRNAMFIAVAIPISMLITFALLYMFDVTLNMIVLFSLILVLGNLVDCSIVVVENTYRHMQLGANRVDAAYLGASEVAWPIIASTLTTVAGFAPLLFWPGIMGDFMYYLPCTVCTALMASLFVGMVVNPAMASLWMPTPKRRIVILEDGRIERNAVLRGYGWVLRHALRWRLVTATFFATMLVSIVMIFAAGAEVEFLPDVEPSQANVDVELAQGTNLQTSDAVVRQIEARMAPESPNMEYVISNVGSQGVGYSMDSGANATHKSRITLKFPDLADCKVLPSVVINRIRKLVGEIAGADIRIEKEEDGPPTGPPVNIEITGDDFDVLSKLAVDIQRYIRDIPNLVDLRDDYDQGKPEVRVNVDRQRAFLAGLNTQFIGLTVKAAIDGMKAGEYREGDKEYDVMVRFPRAFREDFASVESMNLINLAGVPIPFSAVARLEQGAGLGSIRRIDRKRTVTIEGDVDGRSGAEVLKDVRERLTGFPLPSGYSIAYTGENEDMVESQQFLMRAFIVALFLITLVMVAEFNSLLQPLVIMSTVVLSLSGVFLSLVLLDMPFDIIMTGLAVIGLAGVVVNNGIVLLDFINQQRAQGMAVDEAIIEAGMTRFRPVMLTAVTTVLGLVPMAIGLSFDFRQMTWIVGGESAQWWGPMAIAFIVGLLFATFLTLLVVPVLYSAVESFRALFARGASDVASAGTEPAAVK